jgi:hypothetical protein
MHVIDHWTCRTIFQQDCLQTLVRKRSALILQNTNFFFHKFCFHCNDFQLFVWQYIYFPFLYCYMWSLSTRVTAQENLQAWFPFDHSYNCRRSGGISVPGTPSPMFFCSILFFLPCLILSIWEFLLFIFFCLISWLFAPSALHIGSLLYENWCILELLTWKKRTFSFITAVEKWLKIILRHYHNFFFN